MVISLLMFTILCTMCKLVLVFCLDRPVWGDGLDIEEWATKLDAYLVNGMCPQLDIPHLLSTHDVCRLLSEVPNWPKWSANSKSGVKWFENFPRKGTSPRSRLISAIAAGQPDEQVLDIANTVVTSWTHGTYNLPESRKRK